MSLQAGAQPPCGALLTRLPPSRLASPPMQVCLFGSRSEYVMSGSDDGAIFAWNFGSGRVLNVLPGDRMVSCVQVRLQAGGWAGRLGQWVSSTLGQWVSWTLGQWVSWTLRQWVSCTLGQVAW